MNANEKAVGIASTMYDARRLVVALQGREKFIARVDEFRPLFVEISEKHGLDEMATTLRILKGLDRVGEDGMPRLLVLASCVEIMEPSTPAPAPPGHAE